MSEWTAETAEWYAEKYGEYPTNRLTIDAIELAPDARVLDIGCGTAAALRHASTRVTSGALVGVDPIPRMIEIARERLAAHPARDRVALHVAPAHALPLPDASINVALALDSYDHWGDVHQRAGLQEVRRVVARGGRFIIVKDMSVPALEGARQRLLDALGDANFALLEEREVRDPEATFMMWTFART